MKMMHHDSVSGFVQFRLAELADSEYREQRAQEQKPITVRLPAGHIALVDLLASELALTRQAFLFEILSEALNEASMEMARALPEEQRDDAFKHYKNILEGRADT